MVQHMVADAAREIAAGRRDVVLVAGGEAEHTKRRARKQGLPLTWLESDAGGAVEGGLVQRLTHAHLN